jgi:nitrite reductase (NADH) small subunit
MTGYTRVGRSADIPLLEGRSVAVAGRRVAVFRLPEGFVALDSVCPHSGGPLSDGIVADNCVSCPLHGWRFDLRSGAPTGGGATSGVTAHTVRERDGELYVRLAPALEEAA